MDDDKQTEQLLDVDSILPILGKMTILAGLSEKQLYELFRVLEKVSYRAGQKIFEQGDEPSYIYIIKSGRVKLSVSEDGTDLELVVFEQGRCFGEASVIGVQPHGATATAMEATELIVLSRNALLSIYHDDLALFSILILNIAREVCRRLHGSSETLLQYILQQ